MHRGEGGRVREGRGRGGEGSVGPDSACSDQTHFKKKTIECCHDSSCRSSPLTLITVPWSRRSTLQP